MPILSSRTIAVLVFTSILASVPAFSQTAPASKEVQTYEKFMKNNLPAANNDMKVSPNAVGFAAKWAGQPMYKMMLWCAVEIDATTPEDMNSRTAFAITSDADELYGMNHDRSEATTKAVVDARTWLDLKLVLMGYFEQEVGRKPDLHNCERMHLDYLAMKSGNAVTPAPAAGARPAPSSAAIPYLESMSAPNDKDVRITTLPGSAAQKWIGHTWYQSMVWCEALTYATAQTPAHIDENVAKAALLNYAQSARERLSKDRGISESFAAGFIGQQVERISKLMVDGQFPQSPQGATEQRTCTDIQKAYTVLMAGK